MQNGAFLVSNFYGDVEKELLSSKYSSIDFHKILIRADLYCDIFKALRRININSKVIYGDLPGLSKKLKMDMIYYSKIAFDSSAK